jgi:hypothetical protein
MTLTDSARALATARSTVEGAPLGREELRRLDAWWRAAILAGRRTVATIGEPRRPNRCR